MRTEKQIQASRINGARSRGPVTPEGKARSGRKQTRHFGLARAVIAKGENPRLFNDFVDKLNHTLRPESYIDHLLIGRMAAAHYRQVQLWFAGTEGTTDDQRRETSLDRPFHRALNTYMRLRGKNLTPIETMQLQADIAPTDSDREAPYDRAA